MRIKSKKGFTIIEVVLVLAIAGLIFLMVFIALPTMQRSQRDTQRRNDFSQFSAAMTSYMTNNNGSLPKSFVAAVGNTPDDANADPKDAAKYINDTGTDPNGFFYKMGIITCENGTKETNGHCKGASSLVTTNATREDATHIYLVKHAGCNEGYLEYRSSARAFAVFGNLEAGNGTYCSAST